MPTTVEEAELVAEDLEEEPAPKARRPIDMAPISYRDGMAGGMGNVPWRDGPPMRHSEPTLPEGLLPQPEPSQTDLPTKVGSVRTYRDGHCALCGQTLEAKPEPGGRRLTVSLDRDTVAIASFVVGGLVQMAVGFVIVEPGLIGAGVGGIFSMAGFALLLWRSGP